MNMSMEEKRWYIEANKWHNEHPEYESKSAIAGYLAGYKKRGELDVAIVREYDPCNYENEIRKLDE